MTSKKKIENANVLERSTKIKLLDGVTHELKFSFNSAIVLCDEFGSIGAAMKCLDDMQNRTNGDFTAVDFKVVRSFLRAALAHEHEEDMDAFTAVKAGNLVPFGEAMADVFSALTSAIENSYPEPPEELKNVASPKPEE